MDTTVTVKYACIAILSALAQTVSVQTASAQTAKRPPIVSVSHLAVYTTDAAKTEAFYVHDLGAAKRPDTENPAGVRYYFNPVQFVEVLPLPPGPASINRLDHAAFNTADAEGLRLYLKAQGTATPAHVERGSYGSRWFDVVDPEGQKIEFVQPPPPRLPSPSTPCPATSCMWASSSMTGRARTASIAACSAFAHTGSAA